MAAFRLIRFVRMCGIQSQTRRSDATGPQQTDRIRVPGGKWKWCRQANCIENVYRSMKRQKYVRY